MKMLFSLVLAVSPTVLAAPGPELPEQNVILITWDGVRAEDIASPNHFGGDFIPNLRQAKDKSGFFFGSQTKGDVMVVGNSSAISRPGYRAMLTGDYEAECFGNADEKCPAPVRATFIDDLIDHGVPASRVGLFASWEKFARELELQPRAVRSVDQESIVHADEAVPKDSQAVFMRIAALSRQNRPWPFWSGARYDTYTWQMAMEFLKTRPRFMYIALNDSDEWGHKFSYPKYAASIRQYDRWFADLQKALAALPDYGRHTSILITTDHGRGTGPIDFHSHDMGNPGSEKLWAFVFPSASRLASGPVFRTTAFQSRTGRPAREGPGYSQLDIRPTVEKLLGVPTPDGKRLPLVHWK